MHKSDQDQIWRPRLDQHLHFVGGLTYITQDEIQ